ncbi:MAG: imidazole glycerol phosphate synthase subunit HisH [Gammaproteobacteria bacterium]
MKSTVAVVDYGMGNLHSIAKALQHADSKANVEICSDSASIIQADRVVFPGVGAIRDCMDALVRYDLVEALLQCARTKPLLGVCLGMQALLSESEENDGTRCLDIMPGKVVRFAENLADQDGEPLKIPHMGWNQVHQQYAHPLWSGIPQDSRFYFVHSYYARPAETAVVAATTEYPKPFACALALENLFAVQFHPEKSQSAGLRLLSNFLQWNGEC